MIRLKRIVAFVCGLMLILQLSGAARAQEAAADVSGQITHLLDFIRTSPCTFVRSGSDYDGAAAARHIKQKYDYYKADIHSAEEFIDLAATKSYLSGQAYQVRCPGDTTVLAADWLLAELLAYRSHSAAPGSSAN